jgi:hypothetical protein
VRGRDGTGVRLRRWRWRRGCVASEVGNVEGGKRVEEERDHAG